MMRSVSMSSPRSGSAVPAISTIRALMILIRGPQSAIRDPRRAEGGSRIAHHLSHVDDLARNRGGGDHRRAHEQSTAGRTPLPPFEVAVRRGRAHLPPLELVGVHAEAHRASGAAPFKPRIAEHRV